MNPEPKDRPALVQRLGLYTATMIVMGSMIGSGIFKKPAVMAAQLRSPFLLLLTWMLAGVVTLFGALSNAEIAGMITAVGGQYVFFRRIYNNFIGYMYGWAIFAVIQTASIASIAYIFAEYSSTFFSLPNLPAHWEQLSLNFLSVIPMTPLSHFGIKMLTVTCILFLTAVNICGVAVGGAVQDILTTLKILAIGIVVLLAFFLGQQGNFSHFTAGGGDMVPLGGGFFGRVGAMGLAFSGAFWAFDGWNNITYVAGEVRSPSTTIPQALFLGTTAVIAVYVLTNLAYLYVLPLSQMARSELVAAAAMKQIIGTSGAALISALVMLSTFGTANGTILASARVSYAMARDGLFFRSLGHVHPYFHTPARALLVQGMWASLLVFSGTFDQLTDMAIFVQWIFYCLGALGIFVLRKKEPMTARPYRVWGYPVVPAVFVLFAAVYVGVTLIEGLRNALLGLLLVALGIPFYFYWRRSGSSGSAGPPGP